MIFIMLFQALIFYVVAVYGGLEKSLSQNASDILSERLYSRGNEIETRFNNKWTDLDSCAATLGKQYAQFEQEHGKKALASDAALQVSFLSACSSELIDTLRYSETNGIFLILNNSPENASDLPGQGAELYGLCIRDMDQESNYAATEDLVIERSPSSIIDSLDCSLDSWWEAKYSFATKEQGDYYFSPIDAAWQNPTAKGEDIAYLSPVHQISGSDQRMVSYSIPLISEDGYPYGVLGVELSVQYLETLLPSRELNEKDAGCYVLALQEDGSKEFEPIVGSGTTYKRCFGNESSITLGEEASTGGYAATGRNGTKLYAMSSNLDVYNNNNPFANHQLVLLAMVEDAELFAYIDQIKTTLLIVALLSLLIGIAALAFVSRRFAAPITALAQRVRSGDEFEGTNKLARVGITEIDQLVDAIEELNRDVSRDSARTEFFSRMSHDMRTPMNAIISFSSPELLEKANEKVKDDYLDKIHSSGMYLLGLINEVLDLTKIESNNMELHSSAVCAAHLFDTTISVIDKLALKKDISFAADIDVPEDLWITADELHLNQILINLLSNAVKFTPAGGQSPARSAPSRRRRRENLPHRRLGYRRGHERGLREGPLYALLAGKCQSRGDGPGAFYRKEAGGDHGRHHRVREQARPWHDLCRCNPLHAYIGAGS